MIHISDKAMAAMDKYFLQGLKPEEICNKLSEDGFTEMEVEGIRAVLNEEDLQDVIDGDHSDDL